MQPTIIPDQPGCEGPAGVHRGRTFDRLREAIQAGDFDWEPLSPVARKARSPQHDPRLPINCWTSCSAGGAVPESQILFAFMGDWRSF